MLAKLFAVVAYLIGLAGAGLFFAYVVGAGTDLASLNNPVNTSFNTATRTWTDINRNYVPDCDLISPGANGECGAIDNLNFGKSNPSATIYASDVLTGWKHRGYSWQGSASVQRELTRAVSVNVGYFRTWYGNFMATDNLRVVPADYSPYSITAPADPRLPAPIEKARA